MRVDAEVAVASWYAALAPYQNERQRRLWAGAEAVLSVAVACPWWPAQPVFLGRPFIAL
jgi:hypothetical protein